MSRPICWVCSKQLMYVAGKPVFAVIVDPIGAEHRVHKACAKQEQADREAQRAKDFRQFTGGAK
jgi:hypothetical protein